MNLSRFLINKKKSTPGQPAIISSTIPSPWGSCRIITPNLQKSYDLLFPKANFFSYYPEMSDLDLFYCAQEIKKTNPSHIIFIDHHPHPRKLLTALRAIDCLSKNIQIIFHVYGDFTLQTFEWLKCKKILQNSNVRFICASKASQKLVSQFLKQKQITSVCPFPISTKDYHYSPKAGLDFRKKNHLKPNDFIITYAGRISAQKNILALLRILDEKTLGLKNVKILLAGPFDDIAAPLFGIYSKPGSYKSRVLKLILKINKAASYKKIIYIGSLKKNELFCLYNATNLYCSLSTYHDEDFGMAPLESLFCGSYALLSAWGGYHGYKNKYARLIKISVDQFGLKFNPDFLEKLLKQSVSRQHDPKQRKTISHYYQKWFSIEKSCEILDSILKKRAPLFQGFSPLALEYNLKLLKYKKGIPIYPGRPTKNGLYYRIYRSYLEGL